MTGMPMSSSAAFTIGVPLAGHRQAQVPTAVLRHALSTAAVLGNLPEAWVMSPTRSTESAQARRRARSMRGASRGLSDGRDGAASRIMKVSASVSRMRDGLDTHRQRSGQSRCSLADRFPAVREPLTGAGALAIRA